MAAIGLGLDSADALSSLMLHGPHLLAPTGSDLGKFTEPGRVLAGYHCDLNLLTIHGKSRYPGLHAWTRGGTKLRVAIPDGCLLVQAGLQLERLCGGAVQAGMHEVALLPETAAALARQAAAGRPKWRVSSTLFAHAASDRLLEPLGPFHTEAAAAAYPPIRAGEQVMEVLRRVSLSRTARQV